jgi:hypothetical protein
VPIFPEGNTKNETLQSPHDSSSKDASATYKAPRNKKKNRREEEI